MIPEVLTIVSVTPQTDIRQNIKRLWHRLGNSLLISSWYDAQTVVKICPESRFPKKQPSCTVPPRLADRYEVGWGAAMG